MPFEKYATTLYSAFTSVVTVYEFDVVVATLTVPLYHSYLLAVAFATLAVKTTFLLVHTPLVVLPLILTVPGIACEIVCLEEIVEFPVPVVTLT